MHKREHRLALAVAAVAGLAVIALQLLMSVGGALAW